MNKKIKDNPLVQSEEMSNFENNGTSCLQKIKNQIMQNMILFLTIIGIFGGIFLGFVGRIYDPSETTLMLISFPGEMLLRLLKMLILPLIISSLITGLAQLDPKSSGKMGSRAMGFYVLSTLIATTTGVIVALIIRPGREKKDKSGKETFSSDSVSTLDAILDIIRNMFPENIVQACTQQVLTKYNKNLIKKKHVLGTILNSSITEEYVEVIKRELIYINSTNVMGLVVFCIIFGIFISHSKSEAQVLYDFFFVMNELIMKIVALIMWYSPFGILCLVAGNIMKIENMAETAKRLSIYMFTVIVGLVIHALFTMQVIYFLTTRKNPFKFLKGMLQAWLTAVGTASSSATLPITFRCLEENNKVDKRVTRFMLPLGATINMDGTALYQCVATIFIAQLNGVSLSIGQILVICLTSTATSIGVASIPSAALVTMLIVLSAVGLPTEDISYIVTVDWLLDRLRTSINVLGDAYGCGIVEHLSRNELKKLDEEAENEFTKIIAINKELSYGNFGTINKSDEPYIVVNNADEVLKESVVVCDEKRLSVQLSPMKTSQSNQLNEFKTFSKNHSTFSVGKQNQSVNFSGSSNIQKYAPSVVVMDAVRRRSRALLYNTRLPNSVYSMPQISQFTTQTKASNNRDTSFNQDSNV